MWARTAEVAIGVWLLFSPFIFGPHSEDPVARIGNLICGSAVIFLALLSYWHPLRHAHFASVAAVLWLVIAGYVQSGVPAAPRYQNQILTGLTLFFFVIIPSNSSNPPESWKKYFRRKSETTLPQQPG